MAVLPKLFWLSPVVASGEPPQIWGEELPGQQEAVATDWPLKIQEDVEEHFTRVPGRISSRKQNEAFREVRKENQQKTCCLSFPSRVSCAIQVSRALKKSTQCDILSSDAM
jgi:hypothetical protein